jgi:hypothetical protein
MLTSASPASSTSYNQEKEIQSPFQPSIAIKNRIFWVTEGTNTEKYRNGYMSINPRFTKLITALRTAVEKGDGTLDKDATSHDDCLDAFRLSLQFWH